MLAVAVARPMALQRQQVDQVAAVLVQNRLQRLPLQAPLIQAVAVVVPITGHRWLAQQAALASSSSSTPYPYSLS